MAFFLSLFLICGSFEEQEMAWREARDARLRSPEESWLNVVGFFWLKPGENRFGNSEAMDIVLPPHSTVAHAGSIFLEDHGTVRYEMNLAQKAVVDGNIQNKGELAWESEPTVIHHNALRLYVIERGGKLAVRVRDLRASAFLDFKGLEYYDPDPAYVVQATFETFDEPRSLTINTVIDTEEEMRVPGRIVFRLFEQEHELLPFQAAEGDELFIVFKDLTAGEQTYPGGRFLYADPPVDGKVILNFNRAFNPPCSLTPFATCPLPPLENGLNIPVDAGERYLAHSQEPLDSSAEEDASTESEEP